MAYSLSYRPEVTAFLRTGMRMSRSGRIRLFARIDHDLRHNGDALMADVSLRLATDPACFFYQRVFVDDPAHGGDGSLHHLRLVVDTSAAAMGVLQLLYADEIAPPEYDFDV